VTTSDTSRRRVLFLVPTLRRAGAETQVVDLVNALDARRFDKHLAFFEPLADQLDRVNHSEVTVHQLSRRHKLDLDLVNRLASVIDEHQIEAVHCTLQISLFYAFLAGFRTRSSPRLVAALHTTVNLSLRQELYDRLLFRLILRRCDRIVFVCHAQSRHWIHKYPELAPRAAVVYNGVDPSSYQSERAGADAAALRIRLGIAPQQPVIACIAGLRPEKGHGFLLEAFAGLERDPQLLLAGDGPKREELTSLVTKLGLQRRVHFLGEVRDVRPVIAASDVTVLASTAVETFSMAMLESMAMGVPVIVTNIGGLSEAIRSGETGDLVPPGDAVALRRSLQRMIDHDAERRTMGEQARERVRRDFSQQVMAAATADVLSEVLSGSARDVRLRET